MRRVQLNPYLEKTKLSEKMIEDDLKPSFNPKRGVRKETPNPIEEDFVCIFYGHAGHLDEFCFCRKRIKKRHFQYARDSYHDELLDFLPHSFSHASPRTSSHVLPHFSHGPNHRPYGFGS
jgi:hypothetical protein